MTEEQKQKPDPELADIESMAIQIGGLADVLSDSVINCGLSGIPSEATRLIWAYSSLARLCQSLAEKLDSVSY